MDAALVLADVAVVAHLCFLGYVVLGGFLGLRGRWWLVPHGLVVLWAVYGEIHPNPCPLTTLQKWLVTQGGGTPYRGPFIDHYLAGRLYPTGGKQVAVTVAAAVVLASYVLVIHHWRTRRTHRERRTHRSEVV